MELLKQTSTRLMNNGQPFVDLYLSWTYEGQLYMVRVKPSFARDFSKLVAQAKECKTEEGCNH